VGRLKERRRRKQNANGSELPELDLRGWMDGSAVPPSGREEIEVPGADHRENWFLMPGGDWAPSVEEAPDTPTLRPFTAGIAQAPIAARKSEIPGILMLKIE
jgi:hypothetical protein